MTGRRVKTIAEFGRAGRVVNDLKASHDRLYEALSNIENDDGSVPPTIWDMCQAALLSASTKEGGE